MTLEALLTFFGILIAILAVARPVQRHSLGLFVPSWLLVASVLVSFLLIVCRDAPFGVSPPFGWPLPKVLFGLTLSAFLVPVGAAAWSWVSWKRAKLSGRRIDRVEDVFQAALREHEFDEVERIVRKNHDGLRHLPASAASVLFSSPMVAALIDSHSLVHLELLSNMEFLRSLENRFGAVDVVVRELLRTDVSPLRSAVVERYGGLERPSYSDSERALMEMTFQNPAWYSETRADYPLTISAMEALRSGKLDAEYNDIGRDYEARQGISKRSSCPIYLAVKTHVLAIEAAIKGGIEGDFYVSDLLDVFRAVQERSDLDETVWEDPRANSEFPTPYAFLLYTITADLDDLSCDAVERASRRSGSHYIEAPGGVAHALAQNWSFCVWSIADSWQQVTPKFRNQIIEEYLVFILKLGWEPSEISLGATSANSQGLGVWRDLFLNELKARSLGNAPLRRAALEEAMKSLDHGKSYVFQGYAWLEEQLFGPSH